MMISIRIHNEKRAATPIDIEDTIVRASGGLYIEAIPVSKKVLGRLGRVLEISNQDVIFHDSSNVEIISVTYEFEFKDFDSR
jgi:hypothetical protein